MTGRSHVAQRLAKRSVIDALRLESRRADAPRAWTAASRWRRSGGRRTISARRRSRGVDSRLTPLRWRSIAARATQPPRPNRSSTMSPGAEPASSRDATSAGGGGGANRSNAGRLNPGSARRSIARPAMAGIVADERRASGRGQIGGPVGRFGGCQGPDPRVDHRGRERRWARTAGSATALGSRSRRSRAIPVGIGRVRLADCLAHRPIARRLPRDRELGGRVMAASSLPRGPGGGLVAGLPAGGSRW